MKKILAADLDRTVIFSKRFLDEHEIKDGFDVAEIHEEKIISYISFKVKEELKRMNDLFIPVTARSIDEYNRVNLGVYPEYAITTCGGVILKDGKPIKEYDDAIRKNIDYIRMASLMLDINSIKGIERDCKLIDNKYIFTKACEDKKDYVDEELSELSQLYEDFDIFINGRKIYAIPRAFNKAVALRWLQTKIEAYKLVGIGDSMMDACMIYISDVGVVPKHGELYKKGVFENAVISDKTINCLIDAIVELKKI